MKKLLLSVLVCLCVFSQALMASQTIGTTFDFDIGGEVFDSVMLPEWVKLSTDEMVANPELSKDLFIFSREQSSVNYPISEVPGTLPSSEEIQNGSIELHSTHVMPNGSRFVVLLGFSSVVHLGRRSISAFVSRSSGGGQYGRPKPVGGRLLNSRPFLELKRTSVSSDAISSTQVGIVTIDQDKKMHFFSTQSDGQDFKIEEIILPNSMKNRTDIERVAIKYLGNNKSAVIAQRANGHVLIQVYTRNGNSQSGSFSSNHTMDRRGRRYRLDDVKCSASGELTLFLTDTNNEKAHIKQRRSNGSYRATKRISDNSHRVYMCKGGVAPNGTLRAAYLTTGSVMYFVTNLATNPTQTKYEDKEGVLIQRISTIHMNNSNECLLHFQGDRYAIKEVYGDAQGTLSSPTTLTDAGVFPAVVAYDNILRKKVSTSGEVISVPADRAYSNSFFVGHLDIEKPGTINRSATLEFRSVSKGGSKDITPEYVQAVAKWMPENLNWMTVDGNSSEIHVDAAFLSTHPQDGAIRYQVTEDFQFSSHE